MTARLNATTPAPLAIPKPYGPRITIPDNDAASMPSDLSKHLVSLEYGAFPQVQWACLHLIASNELLDGLQQVERQLRVAAKKLELLGT